MATTTKIATWLKPAAKNKGEVNTNPSKTVPNQVEPLRTLLEKYSMGQPVGGWNNPIYQEDPKSATGEDLYLMDKVQIAQLAKTNKEKINKLREEMAKAKAAQAHVEKEQLRKTRDEVEGAGSDNSADNT